MNVLPAKIFRNGKGKSVEIQPWLILVILAAIFLLPQSPLQIPFMFTVLPTPEATYSWQGLEWKYNPVFSGDAGSGPISGKGFEPSTLQDGSLSLKYLCEVQECYGLFTGNFNISQFSEITITTTDTSQSEALLDNTEARIAYYVTLDDYVFDSIETFAHCDGGGCTPMTTAKASVGTTIRFIKEFDGWAVYSKGQRSSFISNLNPRIQFSFTGNNRAGVKSFGEAIIIATFKGGQECQPNEVKLTDGSCKVLIRTCIDNNLNNICDPDDPIVYQDPDSSAPVCSDRDNDRVCDDVASLFCKDSNNNKICDSDEVKWYATYCPDTNSNGICDGIESGTVLCPTTYNPVCDPITNITFPNGCLASGFGIIVTEAGACKVPPIIIRLDCATGAVPIPSGYTCNFEAGWLIKTEKIYENVYIDCRSLPSLEGYTCKNIGTQYVFVKTEFVNIDCYSTGCPANSPCQGGICVTSAKRCPTEVECATYGSDTSCDAETGLCVKTQYLAQDCSILGCPTGNTCISQNNSKVCIQSQTKAFIEPSGAVPIFGTPSKTPWGSIIIVVIAVAGLAALAARKK